MDISPLVVAPFVAALGRRDREQALLIAGDAVRSGVPFIRLITDLLGPAQVEVGRLWEGGHWTVAEEHAATAIVDHVLQSLAPTPRTRGSRGRVIVACAEGEYHALPAAMVSAYLEACGWHTDFLGASVSGDSLRSSLTACAPMALLVSCSMPVRLHRAMNAVEVAHAAGVLALAGGLGFGPDESRALALGADAWASSPAAAVGVLEAWRDVTPRLARPRVPTYGEHIELRANRNQLIEELTDALATAPSRANLANNDRRDAVRAGFGVMIDTLATSELVHDPNILGDHLRLCRPIVGELAGGPSPSDLVDILASVLSRRGYVHSVATLRNEAVNLRGSEPCAARQ